MTLPNDPFSILWAEDLTAAVGAGQPRWPQHGCLVAGNSRWADSETARLGSLELCPPAAWQADLARAYAKMAPTCLATPPPWSKVVGVLREAGGDQSRGEAAGVDEVPDDGAGSSEDRRKMGDFREVLAEHGWPGELLCAWAGMRFDTNTAYPG